MDKNDQKLTVLSNIYLNGGLKLRQKILETFFAHKNQQWQDQAKSPKSVILGCRDINDGLKQR